MPVRSHAPWLTQTDERLLELLAADGSLDRSELQPRLEAAAPALSVTAATIEDRCTLLLDEELVTESDDGVALTAAGKRFLDGRLDLSTADPAFAATDGPDAPTNDYWTCPDCRWVGDHDDLAVDDTGDAVCPVCGNDWAFDG